MRARFVNEQDEEEFDEEKMREDLYDPQDDYGKFCSRQPGEDFDLDQEIYDRNPDYDVDESVNESSSIEGDYAEAVWKMDKFMPEDPDLQSEYWEMLNDEDIDEEEKVERLIEFFDNYADEDIMNRYFPKGGTLEGFAKYIVDEEAV
jgi:hypothetical protein